MRRSNLAARLLAIAAVAVSVVAFSRNMAAAAQDLLDFKDSNTREILKRSRQAVGGPGGADAVARLQSVVFSGLSRIPANRGMVECELEIRILLPDHYLRIDRAPFGERRSGFDGKHSLSVISERGRTTLPPESLIDQIVQSERERMLQVLLGSAAYLSPRDVIMVRSVAGDLVSQQAQTTAAAGSAEAARRRQQASGDSTSSPAPATGSGAVSSQTILSGAPSPYAFDLSVRPGAAFRFNVDPTTFLPAKLTYANTAGDDVTIAFSERRLTDGLKVPYRITTTSRGRIIDDLLLERVDVNPKLTKADFER